MGGSGSSNTSSTAATPSSTTKPSIAASLVGAALNTWVLILMGLVGGAVMLW